MFSKQKHRPSPQLKIGQKDDESLLLGWGGEKDGGAERFEGEGGHCSYHDSNISGTARWARGGTTRGEVKKGGKRERNVEGRSRGGKVGTVKELPLRQSYTYLQHRQTHTHRLHH